MNSLDQIIKDYLSNPDTDYAIMISGSWGCGKSYYIAHDFIRLIKDLKVPTHTTNNGVSGYRRKKNQTEYSPALISLYGVSSVEDFEYRVFCGINPWAKNHLIRALGVLASKFAETKGISSGKHNLNDLLVIGKHRVLVFDDLERISEQKLPVKEALGLINSYAEHLGLKVILVCNEDKFLADDADSDTKEDYIRYKEKSIRFTHCFVSDLSAVYDAMVSGLPLSPYKDYLNTEKESILNLFRLGGDFNLRTLRFFIDTFGRVFEIAKGCPHEEEVLRSFLVTYMLYSLEYKRGILGKDLESLEMKKYQIDTAFWGKIHQQQASQEGDQEESYQIRFNKRYAVVIDEFRPNQILLDYIRNGYLDNKGLEKAVAHLNTEFQNLVSTPEGITYQRLNKMEDLNDGETAKLIANMLSFVKENKYNLSDLLRVYALLVKYDYWGIEGFKLTNDIDLLFKESIERQKESHVYDRLFDVSTPVFDERDKARESIEKYDSLKSMASRINRSVKLEKEALKCQIFLRVAESGDIMSLRAYRSGPEKAISVNGMNWKRVWSILNTAPSPVACELCNCLIFFVPDSSRIATEEINNIRDYLLPQLNEYLVSEDKAIRRVFIAELQKHLTSIVDRRF